MSSGTVNRTKELFRNAQNGPADISATLRIEVDFDNETIASQTADDMVEVGDAVYHTLPVTRTISKDLTGGGKGGSGIFTKPDPPYKFITRIGHGGMGEVWRADQFALQRNIAVKVIRPREEEDKMLRAEKAFLKEALVTASLQHPNIMPVHDLHVSDDGRLMMVMQEIRGVPWSLLLHPYREENIARREALTVRAERTPLRQHLQYLISVCDAISYSHSQGYIHRDIKPEQVMIGDYGEVILLDWGLAIQTEEAQEGVDTVCGTPAYMAPEQTAVPKAKLSELTDVYLLGGLLYELLTLSPPHKGSDAFKCLYKAAMGEVTDPVEVRPNAMIPAELSRLAMWALSAIPADRPASAKEFRQKIHEFLTWRPGELDQKDGFYEVRRGVQPAQERDILVKTIADFEGRFKITDLSHSAREDQNKKNQAMLTEARILRRLSHPNMPVLYDVDIDGDGRPTLLLRPYPGKNLGSLMRPHPKYGDWAIRNQLNPYIEGQPDDVAEKYKKIFNDWLAGPFLELEDLLNVFVVCADVLLYNHEHGIAHRHLRPPCVYVGEHGAVTLTDWGYAVDVRENPEPPIIATPRKQARGRIPPYSAPEVLNEEWERISTKTDVYGLAGLVFQALCGLPPHWPKDEEPADHMGLMEYGANGRVTSPDIMAPSDWRVPPGLVKLAMDGLAFEPSDRPAMSDFRERLRREIKAL